MEPRQILIRSKTFDSELLSELKYLGASILDSTPSMYWMVQDKIEPAWADCVWRDVRSVKIASITEAQRQLRKISQFWCYHGDLLNRRGALIAEKLLKKDETKIFSFPSQLTQSNISVFTMAAADLIYYSHDVRRPTIDGKMFFHENKTEPPSRAYLKLWEAFTVLGEWPQRGERVVDLGASPGSWSWALSQLHVQVTSVDRTELSINKKNIEFRKGDAFLFQPTPMDWVFSDVICFPEKLFDYVQTWLKSGFCKKFICNLKFKGSVDQKVIDQFRKLPHSRVLHCFNSKKEVTWICHPKINQK